MSESWQSFTVVRVLLGAVLMNMVFGTPSSWGNFTVYVTSFLRAHGSNVGYEDTAWVVATGGTVMGFTSYVGGILMDLHGPRFTALLGGVVLSLGVLCSARTIYDGFIPFLFSYSVMFAIGNGIAYSAPMKCVMQWVPSRRGLVTGFVMCGAGLGPACASVLQTMLVNPMNVQPTQVGSSPDYYFTDTEILNRVPGVFYVLGSSYAIAMLLGASLISEPPQPSIVAKKREGEQESQVITGASSLSSSPDTEAAQEEQPIVEAKNFAPSAMMSTREFWLMWFCYFFNMIGVTFATSYVKVFAQNGKALDDHQLTAVASGAALCNGIGRLLWGHVGDVVSFRTAMQGMSIVKAVFTATLHLCTHNFNAYLLSIGFIFASIGGNSSIWPGAISLYFGDQHFGRNFGLLVLAGGLGWFVGGICIQLVGHHFSDESLSFFAATCSFLAAVCGWLMRDRHAFLANYTS